MNRREFVVGASAIVVSSALPAREPVVMTAAEVSRRRSEHLLRVHEWNQMAERAIMDTVLYGQSIVRLPV